MDIFITLTGVGVGIKSSGLGFNVFSGSYIQVKNPASKETKTFALQSSMSPGTSSSTLFLGHIATDAIRLQSAEELRTFTLSGLEGKKLDLEIKGTVAGVGRADITVKAIDKNGVGHEILKRYGVRVTGAQAASTSIRSHVVKIH